ncbi:MAG: NUDIX domain-containing protein [Bacteroidales bacterium]|nr:NUDIX domain-containing protein [Bacteroidales bacterium]
MNINKIAKDFAADAEEMLPLVDREGNIIGKALRSECHKNIKLIHPVVHVHIINSKGEIFLQKRSMKKLIQPGKWDTSVGGHITYGEPLEDALKREAWEEAGVENGVFQKVTSYLWECPLETEYINVYKCHYENPKIIAVAEIDDGKFWNVKDIIQNIGKGILTPNFEKEFLKIKDLIL